MQKELLISVRGPGALQISAHDFRQPAADFFYGGSEVHTARAAWAFAQK